MQDDLFVYNPKTFSISSDTSKSERLLAELRDEPGFIEPTSALSYANRIRVSFSFQASRARFILLRGLIEFHRPKYFLFTYHRESGVIDADIPESEFASFKIFLGKVGALFTAEENFKTSLRHVLEFESRYQAERNAVYAGFIK